MTTAAPLTHHDILQLVGPFSQRGLHVDLPASDRIARRLVFRSQLVQDAVLGPVHEELVLDSLGTGTLTLTRTQTLRPGQRATLVAMGTDAALLLDAVQAVTAQRHFRAGIGTGTGTGSGTGPGTSNSTRNGNGNGNITGNTSGNLLLRSYACECFGGQRSAQGAMPPLRLTQGVLQCDGLTLTMAVSRVRNAPADLALVLAPGQTFAFPDDLLAVLGWNWARLVRSRDGWTSRMRLRGDGLQRTARAEAALNRAAEHLTRTLAEPPARFHDLHHRARWGVVLRRSIPVLTPLALLAAIVAMPRFDPGQNPGLALLLYHVPTLLIAGSFCLQELPRYEVPPLPRRATAASWRAALPQGGVPAQPAQQAVPDR